MSSKIRQMHACQLQVSRHSTCLSARVGNNLIRQADLYMQQRVNVLNACYVDKMIFKN